MKIIIAAVAAIMLGVVVMIFPIVAYTQFSVTTSSNQKLVTEDNNTAQTAGLERQKYATAPFETIEGAGQAYGRIDAGPSPFFSTFLHAMLVVATGLIVATAILIYSKRRI